MNSVYLGACKPIEVVFDAGQVLAVDKRVPLAQTNLIGVACGFESLASLQEFSSCLRYPTRFSRAATELIPATPSQLAVYAADLER